MNPSIKFYPLEKLLLMGIGRIGYKSYIIDDVQVIDLADICRYADIGIKDLRDFEMFYNVKVKCFWLKDGEKDAETDDENGTSTCIE